MSVLRRMMKGIAYALGRFLGLCLLLVALALSVPASEIGSRWLVQQLPSQWRVEGFSGRLLGDWQAQHIASDAPALRFQADGVMWRWQVWRLLRGELVLKQVAIERLHLEPSAVTPDTLAAESAPFETPTDNQRLPTLPFAVRVLLNQMHIGALSVGAQSVWNQLQIQAFEMRADEAWPVRFTLDLDAPLAQTAQPLRVALQVDGELGQQLHFNARTQGWGDTQWRGWFAPLQAHWPVSLTLETQLPALAEALAASTWEKWPRQLRPQALHVQAQGNAADGYQVHADTQLGDKNPLPLKLLATVFAQRLQLTALQLADPHGQSARFSGQFNWAEEAQGEVSLSSGAFDWQAFYPMPELALELRQLSSVIRWKASDFQGDIAVDLHGPMGPLQLKGGFKGDAQQVHLPDFRVTAGSGSAQINAHLQRDAEAFSAALRIQLAALNPAYWHKELAGLLGGELNAEARFSAARGWDGRGQWRVNGQFQGQSLNLNGQVQGQGTAWQLPSFELHLGKNQLTAQGRWEPQRASAQLAIDWPRLEQLWPELSGALKGTLALTGTANAPSVQFQLDAQQVRYGQQRLGSAQLQGGGNLVAHRVIFKVNNERVPFSGELRGAFSPNGDWQGQLAQGQFQLENFVWRLQQSAVLKRFADGRVQLSAHCWQSEEARLCAENQPLAPVAHLRWQLREMALARLMPHLPPDIRLKGQLAADLNMEITAAGPRGSLSLTGGQGEWQMRQANGEWLALPYQQLSLESLLQPRALVLHGVLAGAQVGRVTLDASLDPRSSARRIEGQFQLQALQLALLRPLLPNVDTLTGQLEGQARLSGTLENPLLHGRLQVRQVQLKGAKLPMPMADLNATLQLDGQTAHLDGQWRSGEQGQGQVLGDIRWDESLALAFSIKGRRLPTLVEPYLNVEINPDLLLSLENKNLSLSGNLSVPRGTITIPQLPAQAVRVSDDAQVLGGEPPAATKPLAMNVRLMLGADRLQFSGFGVQADLHGDLQLRDNLDSRGMLSLEKGQYRAYGQRLTLQRARLIFAGPVNQPLLDIEAVRTVDTVTAGIRLSGRSDAPLTEVFSEPSMSQEQALSYLVLGRPLGGNQGDQHQLSQAALALGLAGGAPVARGLAERLGVNDFQLESEGSGLTTSMVASGYLTHNLSLRYGRGVFEPASKLALRYELNRKLYIEAASGLANSLDIFYKKDY